MLHFISQPLSEHYAAIIGYVVYYGFSLVAFLFCLFQAFMILGFAIGAIRLRIYESRYPDGRPRIPLWVYPVLTFQAWWSWWRKGDNLSTHHRFGPYAVYLWGFRRVTPWTRVAYSHLEPID